MIKLRQFGEFLAQEVAARTGIDLFPDDNALMVLRKLEDNGILTPKATQLFHNIRKTGNKAVHQLTGDKGEALYNSLMDGYPFGND